MAADPCIGCGFIINEENGEIELLGPRSEEWPFGVDLEDCNGIRCDPQTDELWVPPDHDLVFTPSSVGAPVGFQAQFGFIYRWDVDTGSLAANPGSPWNTPGADITTTASVTLNNPSDCREMAYWFVAGTGAITTVLDSNVGVNVAAALQVNGGGFVGLGFTNTFRGDNTAPLTIDQVANQNGVLPSDPYITTAVVLAPGGSVTIDAKLAGDLTNPTATIGQQVIIGAGITISIWGQTL